MPLAERVKAAGLAAVIVVSAIGLILAAQALRPHAPALESGIPIALNRGQGLGVRG